MLFRRRSSLRPAEAEALARVLDAPTSDYTRLLRNSVPRPGWKPGSSPSREPLQSVQPIFEFEESQS